MDEVLVARDGGVVTITLHRPDKKNALTVDMWVELARILDEIATSQDDRVLVITGAGDAFCSGADLSGAADGPTGNGLFLMRQTARVALRLHELPQPSIAAVNGVAVGYGCNLALGCDLVLASDAARFSEIFLKRGLAIDGGGSWLLPRLVGLHKAKELAFFADIISAAEALQLGIVNRVVPAAELDALAQDWARKLAAQPPMQISIVKRQLNHSSSMSMAEALEWEGLAQTAFGTSDDAREAMMAFLEKREPRYTGR
jgi:2-(1,2-epoxy-1,2-dihydrophenyl)acetyl-CoA isomerase